jgi:hypothetical protein
VELDVFGLEDGTGDIRPIALLPEEVNVVEADFGYVNTNFGIIDGNYRADHNGNVSMICPVWEWPE